MTGYMYAWSLGKQLVLFPASFSASRDEVEGNINTQGKTKLTMSRGNRHWLQPHLGSYKQLFWMRFFVISRIYKGKVSVISLTRNKSGKQEKI